MLIIEKLFPTMELNSSMYAWYLIIVSTKSLGNRAKASNASGLSLYFLSNTDFIMSISFILFYGLWVVAVPLVGPWLSYRQILTAFSIKCCIILDYFKFLVLGYTANTILPSRCCTLRPPLTESHPMVPGWSRNLASVSS